jgi:hypothetical protein
MIIWRIAKMNIQINDLLSGLGSLATNIRSAITGELTPEKKAEIEAQLILMESKIVQSKADVLKAEIQGQSWLQRNWRPLLMTIIIVIIANNYIIVPYLSAITDKVHVLDLPEKLWSLMTLGVGGYIAGRSGEKIISTWKENK